MREFVYLSTAKLAHFVPQLRVSLPAASVRVATPFAEVELGPSPNPADPHIKQLRRVISHIRRDAKWFGDTSILPGGWIAFEAPLNYAITNSRMVLFVDQPSRSDAYPSGGIRLLLHGSSGNLVEGLDPSTVETPDSSDGEVVERTVRVKYGGSRGTEYVHVAFNAMDALTGGMRRTESTAVEAALEREYFTREFNGLRNGDLLSATRLLIDALDRQVQVETAAWMSGYARVTTCNIVTGDPLTGPRGCVVATPLYVERIPAPAAGGPRRRWWRGRRRDGNVGPWTRTAG